MKEKKEKQLVDLIDQIDQKPNVHTDVMKIVDYFYPNTTKKRYPLTRCLLTFLIECAMEEENEELHNFNTVIENLSSLLDNMSKDNLDTLEELSSTHWLSKQTIHAFDMFYHYSKRESQEFTTACLLYDLIPYLGLSFKEMLVAIENHQKKEEIIEYQIKNAMYQDNKPMLFAYEIRKTTDLLYGTAAPVRNSVFVTAAFHVIQKQKQFHLDFDLEELKDELYAILWKETLKKDMFEHNVFKCKSDFGRIMKWYVQIAITSNCISDLVTQTLELILNWDGSFNDLGNLFKSSCKAAENQDNKINQYRNINHRPGYVPNQPWMKQNHPTSMKSLIDMEKRSDELFF